MRNSYIKDDQMGYWIILMIVFLLSCMNYYKPVTQNTSNPKSTSQVINSEAPRKYFILHQGTFNYAFQNIKVNDTAMTMSGNLSSVDNTHLKYINDKDSKFRYKKLSSDPREINVLNEVHIYTKNNTALDTSKLFTLPLDQITKIQVIEHDKSRSTTSYVLGGVGITLGAIAIAAVIVALTKSSCPFVGVYDGQQYIVQGELFGGAVNSKLERFDYMPLKVSPVNGEIQLRIMNELKEKQYTNFADLIVIEHDSNTQACVGMDGNIYQVSNLVSPISAMLNNKINVLDNIKQADSVSCHFDDTLSASSTNEITLTFLRRGEIKKAKLILNLKNSYWFDYLYGEFTRNFGDQYDKFQKKLIRQSTAQMIRWTNEQNIPLRISLITPKGLKEIAKLPTIGPLMNRQVVIPVELNAGPDEKIQITLSSGFMFWELDYAAIDFTDDKPVTASRIKPYYAVDQDGKDVLNQLTDDDGKYLSQPETGNYAILKYKLSRQPSPRKLYTVTFATRGYYEPIRQYTGKPNTAFLKKFREPGTMSDFSKSRYQFIINTQSIIALQVK
jgi:hypothetical protein